MKYLLIVLLCTSYAFAETYKLKVIENKTDEVWNPITKKIEAVHIETHGACNGIKYKGGSKCYALTAAHLVTDAKEIFIENWKAVLVRKDDDFDIALLRCEKDLKCYSLTKDTKEISVKHAPRNQNLRTTDAKILSKTGLKWTIDLKDLDHGSSGGGVICDEMLLGVVTAMKSEKEKNIGYFLPSNRIKQFLSEESVVKNKYLFSIIETCNELNEQSEKDLKLINKELQAIDEKLGDVHDLLFEKIEDRENQP